MVLQIQNEYINTDINIFLDEKNEQLPFTRANPLITSIACHKIPDIAILDQKKNLLDLNVVKEHFKNGGRLNNQQVVKLIKDGIEILFYEKNIVNINTPTYCVGDIHGQYYDLLSFLDILLPKILKNNHSILFIGDYVDRGTFSCEVFLFLILLKTHYPKNIYLTRGNHESIRMTTYFTFKTECLYKYNKEIYQLILECFNTLPLSAIIQNKAFCTHGGIGPDIKTLDEILKINRFKDIPFNGSFCDLLWSDPHPLYNTNQPNSFELNMQRQVSYYYSYDDIITFLKTNNLITIIRGHEVQEAGFKLYKNYNNHPSIVTVFSAPNYCDVYKNLGGIIFFDQRIQKIENFVAVRHPYVLNGFLDGITWSFPFLIEKILEFAINLLDNISSISTCSSSSNDNLQELFTEIFNNTTDIETFVKKEQQFAKKIALLRVERECIDEFMDDSSTLECCNLITQESNDLNFSEAKILDKNNEKAVLNSILTSDNFSINLSPSLSNRNLNEIKIQNSDFVIKKTKDQIEEICSYKIINNNNNNNN